MRAAPPREWKPLEEAVRRDVFQAEVEAWAKRIGVHPKVVQVRPMKRKWGSCSTAGRVSFDTDLLRQHAEFRKRVIVEELLHLRIPNHGKLFKGGVPLTQPRHARSTFCCVAPGSCAQQVGAG
jgi:hypothetical protein